MNIEFEIEFKLDQVIHKMQSGEFMRENILVDIYKLLQTVNSKRWVTVYRKELYGRTFKQIDENT